MNATNQNPVQSATIRERIREDLLAGRHITPLDGLVSHNTMDLRKRLSELREEGMQISFEWIKNENTGKRYKSHFMTADNIALWKLKSLKNE